MPIKLTSTNVITQYVNILVYGESGSGKTTLAGTAPSPLIISAEGGLLSLAGKNIPAFEVNTRADCNEVYEWLKSSKEARKYETVCLDSISEIGEVLLSDEKALNKDTRAAYGVMNDELAILIRGFRDLPVHTYFTAKTKKVVEEATGAIAYMPSVPGKVMLNDLPYFFDEVAVMSFGKTKEKAPFRYLKTVGDNKYIAKDRSGKLRAVEKPDLTYIFNTITGGPTNAKQIN